MGTQGDCGEVSSETGRLPPEGRLPAAGQGLSRAAGQSRLLHGRLLRRGAWPAPERAARGDRHVGSQRPWFLQSPGARDLGPSFHSRSVGGRRQRSDPAPVGRGVNSKPGGETSAGSLADICALTAVAIGIWLRWRQASGTYLNPDEAIFFFDGSAGTFYGLGRNIFRSQH